MVDQKTEDCSFIIHKSWIYGNVWYNSTDFLDQITPRRDPLLYSKVPLYCNNQGVIFLATNPAQEQHSKHIGIRYHYIRKCIEKGGKIDLFYISTGEQIADIFTKNLSPIKFKDTHRGLCMISYSP